jgi:hypothetical protein
VPSTNSSHRRLLAIGLGVATLAACGCGSGETASYGDGDTGYGAPTYGQPAYGDPTDPAAVLEEQRKIAEALSTTSQLSHEAQMNAINNMTP